MKDFYLIGDIGKHFETAGKTIAEFAESFMAIDREQNPDLFDAYSTILLNELENIQHLTINLTRLLSDIDEDYGREDGSAFFAGELNYNAGDKSDDEDFAIDYVDPDEEEEGD